MHIEYLDYFYQVATAGSISKAAQNAHISQSALSQQISKLEETLGYQLLNRSNKGVQLTEKGEIVFKYADNIIRTYKAMIENLQSSEAMNITIEACWSIATYSLPCVMYIIKNKFPNYNYELNPNDSDTIEQNLLNNICDLGVIYSKPKSPELEHYKVGMDRIVLVASTNYPIPDKIELDDLTQYPFILLNTQAHGSDEVEKSINEIGLQMKDMQILYNSDSGDSVKSSVLNRFGIAFLPYTSIKKELYTKQLKIIDVEGVSIEYDMYLAYNKNTKDNHLLSEFIAYFKTTAKKSLC